MQNDFKKIREHEQKARIHRIKEYLLQLRGYDPRLSIPTRLSAILRAAGHYIAELHHECAVSNLF